MCARAQGCKALLICFTAYCCGGQLYFLIQNCIEEGWINRGYNYAIFSLLYIQIVSVAQSLVVVNIEYWVAEFFLNAATIVEQKFILYCTIYYIFLFIDNTLIILKVLLKCFQHKFLEVVLHYVFFYLIGIPLSLTSAFLFRDPIAGIWIGYGITDFLYIVTIVSYLLKRSWNLEMANIRCKFLIEKSRYI